MQRLNLFSKTPHQSYSYCLLNFLFISSSLCVVFLLIFSVFLLCDSKPPGILHTSSSSSSSSGEHESSYTYHSNGAPTTSTSLEHIIFGIASNNKSWPTRKEYVRLWWRPHQMRGCAFLDAFPSVNATSPNDNSSLPPICISGDTSRFRYTYRNGLRSAIRVARVVLETVALNHSDVRWYVFGDDDTVFFQENLVKTLRKYDHRLWYYVGSNSEVFEQNRYFAFGMAFGGAGFAITAPLAKVLAKVFDSCIQRYPHLYGSDSRVYSCLAELGVALTHEPGFHQLDVRGDIFGLLAAHPLAPLVSMHHIDHMDPIFPNKTSIKALEHLLQAARADPQRILQRTVCYDRWFAWTISVSWGYAVQVFRNHVALPDLLTVQETFKPWKKGNPIAGVYMFNTRPPDRDPCKRPTVFFFDSVSSARDGTKTVYRKSFDNCTSETGSPKKLEEIRVFSPKLDLKPQQLQAPRRHCCDVLPSSVAKVMEISVRECNEDELIHAHQ